MFFCLNRLLLVKKIIEKPKTWDWVRLLVIWQNEEFLKYGLHFQSSWI